MCPHCLATIRSFRGIPHHSRLNPRTFPALSADNPQTIVVLSGQSVIRTLFPRLTRIVRRNGVSHFGNVSCFCLCSSGRQALLAICAGNSPVHDEFPAQRPVTRSFDVFFDLHPDKRLSKQCDLRHHRGHCDVTLMYGWNSFWKGRWRISYIMQHSNVVNTLAADDLATERTQASPAMMLTK